MLTPSDISNQRFSRAFRGYSPLEVDRFLDEVNLEYEKLYKDNKELKDRLSVLEEKMNNSKNTEETLRKTMVLAEKMADQETSRAMAAGDVIRRSAELEAEQMVKKAEEEVLSIYTEVERLKLFEKQLYLKHKGFLEFQMQLLDGYMDEAIEEPAVLRSMERKAASISPVAEETEKFEMAEMTVDQDAEPEEPLFRNPVKAEKIPEEEPVPEPEEDIFTQTDSLNDMADKLEAALHSLEQIYNEPLDDKE